MKNKTQTLKLVLVILTTGILSSCTNDSRYISPTPEVKIMSKNAKLNYKPSINFIGKDLKLAELIKKNESKNFLLNDKRFATFNLYIETSLIPDNLIKPSVNLVGIIKKRKIKYNYKVSYKLVNYFGTTIANEEVIGLGDEPVETISGQALHATDSATKDASQQIIDSLNKQLQNTDIGFKIVAVDTKNVYIAVNNDIKLKSGDIFIVDQSGAGTPLSLEEVIPSKFGDDISLAKLKVLTGVFPTTEMTVTLQK
ncbi:MAG: hypothetical protein GY793_03145 [Proteobacteria bacterium]|nr:hypothetical protein [Pseudomonadota bacterium]